ncbi:HTH-type transcriptional regulator NmtR [compost metagenome]
MTCTKENILGIDIDIIFHLEKFYLDLNQSNNSPESIMQGIYTNYNIPIHEFSDQIKVLNTIYEETKDKFQNYYETPQFVSDFNQLFYVELPTDFSPAFYLYLSVQMENPFISDEIFDEQGLDKRKYIISQIISDDFDNFKNLKDVYAIVDYLRYYPTSNSKKWISIVVLYHAKKLTDQLFYMLDMIKEDYLKFKDIYDDYAKIDLYSESNNTLLSKVLGDTSNKEVIRVSTVACFNGIKFFEHSNRIFVFIGVLYNDIGDLIKQYRNNDKAIVSRLKAIGENKRLGILKELKKGPMCGKDIAELLNLTPATVSHHMNSLVNEGLVSMYKEGTRIDYKINNEEAQKLIDSLKHVFF